MDYENIRQITLDHLISMAQNPATKAHAWHRAQELDKDDSGLFTGIATELKAHMLRLKPEQQSNGT